MVERKLPVGNAVGDPFTSWVNPTSLLVGGLAIVACAYLAAVFLVVDARHDELLRLEAELPLRSLLLAPLSEETFRRFTDDVLPRLAERPA